MHECLRAARKGSYSLCSVSAALLCLYFDDTHIPSWSSPTPGTRRARWWGHSCCRWPALRTGTGGQLQLEETGRKKINNKAMAKQGGVSSPLFWAQIHYVSVCCKKQRHAVIALGDIPVRCQRSLWHHKGTTACSAMCSLKSKACNIK